MNYLYPNAKILSSCIHYFIQNRNLITKFGLVGIIGFILNYFFVWLFYGVFVLDYRIAVTLAYIVTAIIHFMLNRTFTYRANGASMVHHAWKYVVMLAINYMISLFTSIITVEICGLSPYFGIVFATAIMMCSNFFFMKYFVFSHKTAALPNQKQKELYERY